MSAELIARTGRVQSWMDNPESRLPVSCTVFVCDDSMEGPEGIEASWRYVSHALRNAAGVAVHLSKLRRRGTVTQKGPDQLVASGPCSFAKIYSVLNEVLRRGGTFRNGACVVHLDLRHGDINEFLQMSRAELPWVKRCVDITEEWWNEASQETKVLLFQGIQAGDIWLNKVKYDQNGERIYGNVCLEIYLKSRGTCLLTHINLAACRVDDLGPAFVQGMQELIELHGKTGVADSGEYLSPEEDRQVGLGMLGLANFLANHGVTYAEFGDALEVVNRGPFPVLKNAATRLAQALRDAIFKASYEAKLARMDRCWTIAPTATCSYRYTDLKGNTATPEIAPPIARSVDRDSGTFGVQSYFYGDVETASEVGWDAYKKVCDGIVQMMTDTGLFHGYSFNSWSDVCTYDENFIRDWLESPQTSLYYALQVMPGTLAKDDVTSIMDDNYKYIFGLEDRAQEDEFCSSCAE